MRGPYSSRGAISCSDSAIYRITSDDIELWQRSGIHGRALAGWPWQLGAPVLDGDGDPESYNLGGGDVPALRGSQMAWWVMHDTERDDLLSMNLEYRVAAYVHAGAGALENTLFLAYEVENKGEVAIDSAQIGFSFSTTFMDDILAGTDTSRATMFTYPANATGRNGSIEEQPAFGITLLDDFTDPSAVPASLYGTSIVLDPVQYPRNQNQLRNLLQGLEVRGEQKREGGISLSTLRPAPGAPATRYTFPGDPIAKAFWSMENLYGEPTGWINTHSDGRTNSSVFYQLLSGQPVTMAPGETRTATIAITSARADNNIQSLERVFEYVDLLRANTGSLLKSSVSPKPGLTDPDLALSLLVTPNPAGSSATVRYSTPEQAHIAIELFDALGRRVRQVVDSPHEAGVFEERLDVSNLTPGVYYMRFSILGKVFSRSLVVM